MKKSLKLMMDLQKKKKKKKLKNLVQNWEMIILHVRKQEK